MKPFKIIFWVLFAIFVYQAYTYFTVHSSSEVIAYKRFAKAIKTGDNYILRMNGELDVLSKAKFYTEGCRQILDDYEEVFTYYRIRSHYVSEDGNRASVHAEQVTRVNSEYHSKPWGATDVRIRHTVELVRNGDSWKVSVFRGPVARKNES